MSNLTLEDVAELLDVEWIKPGPHYNACENSIPISRAIEELYARISELTREVEKLKKRI